MKEKRQLKSEFALYFPVFNTESTNLLWDDEAYRQLSKKVVKAKTILRDIQDNEIYVADYYMGQFSVLKEVPIHELKIGLEYIQSQLTSKKTIQLRSFFGWTYIPKRLRPTKNLMETMLVGRDPSEVLLIANLLLEQCTTILQLKKVGTLWGTESMSFDSLVKKHRFLTDVTRYAEEGLRTYEKGIQGVQYWSSKLGLQDSCPRQ